MKRTLCIVGAAALLAGCSSSSTASAPSYTPPPPVTVPSTPPTAPTSASPSVSASPSASASAAPTSATPTTSPEPSASPSAKPSATPSKQPNQAALPKGFALPGGMSRDKTTDALSPCPGQTKVPASYGENVASRFSADVGEEHFLRNGVIVFSDVQQAKAFMVDMIAQGQKCSTTKTRNGTKILAKRAAYLGPWERVTFVGSQYDVKDDATWGMESIIARTGKTVAVYQWSGMYDKRPTQPSAKGRDQIKKIFAAAKA